jgi:hypothetical protein
VPLVVRLTVALSCVPEADLHSLPGMDGPSTRRSGSTTLLVPSGATSVRVRLRHTKTTSQGSKDDGALPAASCLSF